ncbi:hypothetical protein BH10ACT9_BH10ACT9_58170 [soil metagenome]
MTTPDNSDTHEVDSTGVPPTTEDGTTPPVATGEDATPTDDPDHDPADDDEIDLDAPPNQEAARWRVKYRDAQRERDESRAQTVALQEHIVARIAESAGVRDAGLLAYEGHDLADLLNDNGVPDVTKVLEACKSVVQQHGIMRGVAPVPGVHPTSVGAGPSGQRPKDAWKSAFAPKNR